MWYYYLGLILIGVSVITLIIVKWSEKQKN
ncbi:hypothetical protein BuS5_01125 [Desulfosarcina sp. BuS5]|nr:hypothetical protein BuS5_01125 [Desulfosarcina sp. BuS5]